MLIPPVVNGDGVFLLEETKYSALNNTQKKEADGINYEIMTVIKTG